VTFHSTVEDPNKNPEFSQAELDGSIMAACSFFFCMIYLFVFNTHINVLISA